MNHRREGGRGGGSWKNKLSKTKIIFTFINLCICVLRKNQLFSTTNLIHANPLHLPPLPKSNIPVSLNAIHIQYYRLKYSPYSIQYTWADQENVEVKLHILTLQKKTNIKERYSTELECLCFHFPSISLTVIIYCRYNVCKVQIPIFISTFTQLLYN